MKDRIDGMYGLYKGMPFIKVYCTLIDFSKYVKAKLPEEDLERFKDCTFVPIKLGLNEADMSIEALIVPVKDD